MKKNFLFVAGRILAVAALAFMTMNPSCKMFVDAISGDETQYGLAVIAVLLIAVTIGLQFIFVAQIATRDYKFWSRKEKVNKIVDKF
jgi:uncharacterized membrane protein YqhA